MPKLLACTCTRAIRPIAGTSGRSSLSSSSSKEMGRSNMGGNGVHRLLGRWLGVFFEALEDIEALLGEDGVADVQRPTHFRVERFQLDALRRVVIFLQPLAGE